MKHELVTTGEIGLPEQIKDRNNHVVLSYCRRCHGAESELAGPCIPPVSDEALRAAIESQKPDRIQGFLYGKTHVIRDVWRALDNQELYRAPAPENAATVIDEAFQERCKMERMRLAIEAALRVIVKR